MASKIKNKIANSVNTSDSEPNPELALKYRLLVTAGPSYDPKTQQQVLVNDPDKTCTFSNDFMTTKVKVRIRNYGGLPEGSPSSSLYFDDPLHEKDSYSIAFSFVPKRDLVAKDLVFGNDFDHPVRDRLPPGVNTAFKIVKDLIDPGLSMDAYSDTPWLYGSALSSWIKFRIGERVEQERDFPIAGDTEVLQEGADGDGQSVRSQLGIPDDSEKRRKFFLSEENRANFVFEEGRCYQGDFFNPFLDFNNFALKLPGFSIGVLKYINDKSHTLRYVFKDRETGDVYFVVHIKLLFGEELARALESENAEKEPSTDAREEKVNDHEVDMEPHQKNNLPEATHEQGSDRVHQPAEQVDESITLQLQQTKTKDSTNKHTGFFAIPK